MIAQDENYDPSEVAAMSRRMWMRRYKPMPGVTVAVTALPKMETESKIIHPGVSCSVCVIPLAVVFGLGVTLWLQFGFCTATGLGFTATVLNVGPFQLSFGRWNRSDGIPAALGFA